MPPVTEQRIEDYLVFIKKAGAYLGPRSSLQAPKHISGMPIHLPGLENLLNSFSSGSAHDKVKDIEEWNPFSQRPIYEVDPQLKPSIGNEFLRIGDTAHRFIILAHEAMHVLMWEPFFCGQFRPSRHEFRELSLAFEGFCFWYADLVVNEKMRLTFPDGESVLERCSVSQTAVHPKTGFKLLRLQSPRKAMNTYIDAFCGYETSLSRKTKDPIVLNLAERFYSFYSSTVEGPNGMFQVFKQFGLLDEFFTRFCRARGLPSLLPGEITSFRASENVRNYCWRVFEQGMKHIEGLSTEAIKGVRLRRSIQMRAYFAFSLRHLLRAGHIRTQRGGFPAAKVLANLQKYIDQLEVAIGELVGEPKAAVLTIKNADTYFSREIRSSFLRHDVRAAARAQLVPDLPGHSQLILDERRENISARKLRLFARAVLNEYVRPNLDFSGKKAASTSLAALSVDVARIIAPGRMPLARKRRLSRKLDQILAHELVFPMWSLPLASVNPERNDFREILFIYK